MTSSVSHQFVEKGFGYLNTKNLEAFFDLYAEKLSSPSLANLGLPPTKAGFQAFVGGFYEAFSRPQFLPQAILVEGDRAMFRWTFKAQHTATFNGVPASGKNVEVQCYTDFRMGNDGKIVEQHDGADLLTLMRQIGALPA